MEDSITERELKTGIEDYQQNDDEDEAHQGDDEQVKGGGSSDQEARKEEDKGQSVADEDQVELGSGNGIINNLISNLFHHTDEGDQGEVMKNIEGEVDHDQGKDQVQEGHEKGEMEVTGGGGGRLINNLISNFFQQNEGEGGGEEEKSTEEKKGVVDEGIDEQVKVEEEGGGGGIINNIVSNLPFSLQENSAPASDEASILIHSIIHD